MHYIRLPLFSVLFISTLAGAVTISDFSDWVADSTYGSWAPGQAAELDSGGDAFRVAATDFGGAYKYLGATGVLPNIGGLNDLSLALTVHSQSNGGAGIGFLVLLEDRDGTVYGYTRFGLQEGSHTLHWLVDMPSKEVEPGTVAGLDSSAIKAINLQIDPGGANDYDVSFTSLQAAVGRHVELASTAVADTLSVSQPSYKTLRDYPYVEQTADTRYANCFMDIYYPEHLTDFPTVVFMHAGGLKQGRRYIPGELMNQGFAVVSISYSLYPSAKAPDFIEDAAAAVAWVFKNIESIGGATDKIFVSGASAGGYLATMVGLDPRWLAEYGVDANELAGIISLSGQAITHVAIREERGGDRAKPVVDALAPLNHVRGDAPPLLIVTGDREFELLGRYEESAYLKRMMEVNGHRSTELLEIKGADHAGVEKPGHGYLVEFVRRIAGG